MVGLDLQVALVGTQAGIMNFGMVQVCLLDLEAQQIVGMRQSADSRHEMVYDR